MVRVVFLGIGFAFNFRDELNLPFLAWSHERNEVKLAIDVFSRSKMPVNGYFLAKLLKVDSRVENSSSTIIDKEALLRSLVFTCVNCSLRGIVGNMLSYMIVCIAPRRRHLPPHQ